MGWEYIKGKGEDGSDLYLDNVYVKDVFYINYRGRAYGFALTEYTDNYKKSEIRRLGFLYGKAALYGSATIRTLDLIDAGVKLLENPSNEDNLYDFIQEIYNKERSLF